MEQAKNNIITKEVEEVSKYEQVSTDFILKGISEGTIVVPKNVKSAFELISNKAIGIMILKMNSLLINISNLHILKNTKLKIGVILRFLNWNK